MSKKVRKMTAEWLDIPADVLTDVPRIVMLGNRQLQIENYLSVESFCDQELVLKLGKGKLHIRGDQLWIRKIYTEEVVIDGKIGAITFLE
ncbi:sporulation protein YqfC [Mechercharimyces sp. CAU 1602]|uniref:sporulation protein YqfC n=1 Tax=Mechercharimyces sp. CAU 1602 TaxID=2973933 RepID=UPI0021632BC4|nr:sporulation protein YqfC [Mechercharimyces sp. CAU 1602]